MSATARRPPWLAFSRSGGRPPRDDESLELAADGTFRAKRTIGGPRIGRFEGELGPALVKRVRKAVDAVADADDVTIETPREGATEVLEVGGRTLRTGSNERAPKPWRGLVDLVRRLFEDEVVASGRAAVELQADAAAARLVHVGGEPVEVDTGSVIVNVVRLDAEGAVVARWRGRHDARWVNNGETVVPTPRWELAQPGWSAGLPYDHPIEVAPGDWLQVWVELPVRDEEGERLGRLYAPVVDDA